MAVVGVLVLAGCGGISPASPERFQIVRDLEAIFPKAQELRASWLTLDQACWEVVTLGGETRRVAPDGDICPSDERVDADAPPDAELHGAITDLRAVSVTARRIVTADFRYRSAGVVAADIGLGDCLWYVFDPGYGELPSGDSYVVRPVDEDWYELSCPPSGTVTAVVGGG